MKRIFTTLLIAFLCGGSLFAQTKIIAHRGYWDCEGSAQNSIAALQKAHEVGVYGSEFDVWITADGVPIVNHDDSIPGFRIETANYNQLKDITLKNGERIPTLEEYLIEGKKYPDMQLILEIKSHRRVINEDRLVAKVVNMVKKHGLENQTEYIAFSMNVCKELKRHAPNASISYLNGDVSPQDLKEIGLTGLDYNHGVLTKNPTWIADAKALGLSTNVWTVNIPEQMQWFIDQKVDYMTTDAPEELKELLEK